MSYNTSVLLVIYKRPDTTSKVFEVIRKMKPSKLYIAADGPKNIAENEICKETRNMLSSVNWKCKVYRSYSDKNLGLQKRMETAITWLFQKEEQGIILEDDCVPDISFFRFCDELLNKYRDDQRIFAISGDKFETGTIRGKYSYYFSRYPHCWGWATWRRAWNHYDSSMMLWPKMMKEDRLNDIFSRPEEVRYWTAIFDRTYKGKINSWAYRWTYSCWVNGALTILPTINLVTNIGFRNDGTHTLSYNKHLVLKTNRLKFPLKTPPFIIRDVKADDLGEKIVFAKVSLKQILINKIKDFIKL